VVKFKIKIFFCIIFNISHNSVKTNQAWRKILSYWELEKNCGTYRNKKYNFFCKSSFYRDHSPIYNAKIDMELNSYKNQLSTNGINPISNKFNYFADLSKKILNQTVFSSSKWVVTKLCQNVNILVHCEWRRNKLPILYFHNLFILSQCTGWFIRFLLILVNIWVQMENINYPELVWNGQYFQETTEKDK